METPIAIDPRSPLVLDVHDLSRRPGTMREEHRNMVAPEGLGNQVISVPDDTEIQLDLRLEAVLEGVLVTGSVEAEAHGECVRCLDEVVEDVHVDLAELFAYPERAKAAVESGDDEDAMSQIEDERIDLEPAIRDLVVTALPFQPLCREDCAGLCPQCGARLADDPDHQHDTIDPRWSALSSVLAQADTHDETKES